MKAPEAKPRVTVFMPVFNREKTLRESIDSVLAQTFPDFELLLIDDGSKDRSVEIVRSYPDPRIRLVAHERNQGIPRTRNHGLEQARGEYLMILDSDDVATPSRLRRQVVFLDRHPDIAAVGSWLTRIDASGRTTGFMVRPTRPEDIQARMLFVSCFKNPAMTARTEVLRRFRYREEFVYCQDIDLWARVSARHRLANLPLFLTRYRTGGESRRDEALALRMKMLAARGQLESFGLDFGEQDLERHVLLRNVAEFVPSAEYVDWCDEWLVRLLERNRRCGAFPEPHFTQAAVDRWILLGLRAWGAGTVSLQRVRRGALASKIPSRLLRYARNAGHDAIVMFGAWMD